MRHVNIASTSNNEVLLSDDVEEFNLQGNVFGIEWDSGLEEFFLAQDIEVVDNVFGETISLGQGDTISVYKTFTEDVYREMIDFDYFIEYENIEKGEKQ